MYITAQKPRKIFLGVLCDIRVHFEMKTWQCASKAANLGTVYRVKVRNSLGQVRDVRARIAYWVIAV